jgi:surface polysaccharide O-acyltransferase-like enzyme
MATPQRLVYGDVVRLAGALAVIGIHVFCLGAYGPPQGAVWWAATWLNTACHWAVPVFLMLSGALLLDPARAETPATFYRKRFGRIGWPLVFWTVFYLGLFYGVGRRGQSLGQLLGLLLQGAPTAHLRYLFIAAGLYAVTPALRYLVRACDRRELGGWTLLALALAATDQVYQACTGPRPTFALTVFVPYVGYYLGGWWLREVRLSARGVALCVVAFVAVWAGTVWGQARLADDATRDLLLGNPMPNIMALAACAWLLLAATGRRLLADQPARQALCARLGAATLGVYLLHPFCLTVTQRLWVDRQHPSYWVQTPVLYAVALGASWAATAVLLRVPGLRVVVGG